MTGAQQRSTDADRRSPEAWTDADREIAGRDARGPFLGANVPDRHAGQVRERLERARLAGVFLDVPCFMAVTRGPEHVVVNATPTVYRIVGRRRVLGLPIRKVLPELAGGPCFDFLDRAFRSDRSSETGLEPVELYRDPDAPEAGMERRWVSFAYHSLARDGTIDGVLITGIDATEKIRARRALETRARGQEAVARLSARALTRPGLRHLADEAVESVVTVLHTDSAALLEPPGSGGDPTTLTVRARTGGSATDHEIPAEGLPEVRALRSGETLNLASPGDALLADHPLAGPKEIASALLVPVPDPGDGVRAVLAAYSSRPGRFDEPDVHFLEGLANTLAAAWRRHESDRFQAILLRNLPGVVYRCRHDREWSMEFLSTGIRELTGYASGELIDNRVLSWADLIHPEDRDQVWREVSRAVAEDVPFQLHYRIRRRDGEVRWVWEQGRAIEGAGSPAVLEGYIFDVTESRAAREELQETRSLLEVTFRSIREAVLVVNAEDRTILACNPAVSEMTGYERDELLGRSTKILHVDEESYLEFGRRGEKALEREGVFRGEYRLRRKDGCVIPTEHLVSYLEPEGNEEMSGAVVSVVRDLSEQKRREGEIRASRRRLQNLSRDLLRVREEEHSRIARNLHDVVGQTLSAVKFGLDALEEDVVPEGAARELSRARDLVGESLRQIRDLSVELRPAVLDDLGLLPAIRWYLDRLRERVDFAVELTLDPELSDLALPKELQTQAFRITQEALRNVERHAGASRTTVELRREDDELGVTVSDDGSGFDPDALRSLRSGDEQLGLLGMEERASLVDGTVAVESAPGEGTTVRFRAPLRARGDVVGRARETEAGR